jgi:hypothetical protein
LTDINDNIWFLALTSITNPFIFLSSDVCKKETIQANVEMMKRPFLTNNNGNIWFLALASTTAFFLSSVCKKC